MLRNYRVTEMKKATVFVETVALGSKGSRRAGAGARRATEVARVVAAPMGQRGSRGCQGGSCPAWCEAEPVSARRESGSGGFAVTSLRGLLTREN